MTSKPFEQLLQKLDDMDFLADIHHVLHFDEVDLPRVPQEQIVRLLVPGCIDELFTNWNAESEEVVELLVTWARPKTRTLSSPALTSLVDAIRNRYLALRELGYVLKLPDEDDPEIRAVLDLLLASTPGPIEATRATGLLERMKTVVKKSVTTVLSCARRTGKAILMRGRNLLRFLRDRFVELEFPSKLDALVDKKARLGAKLVAFKGGKAVKFFVCVGIGTAGLMLTGPVAGPVLGGAGLALGFVDP